ncbi:MAG: ABC transporter ATP-binding protein, partial [Alphaproteobacteria bacterium]
MLELRNIDKQVVGEPHLSDISLKLEKGTLNVLLGPTLAGKTSLMRIMAGLDRPTQGQVLWDGVDVTGVPVQKRNVAMVYQQFINYPALNVYENIASPLRIARLNADAIDSRVREVAALLHLTPYLDRKPLNLSGGQQQRTALARAIVKNADLVLLDEPLANLDYKLREELRTELPKIFARSGAIFVYATTEPSEALLLCGNTATLSQGRVTQYGATTDVFRNPVDLITAETFSDPPLNTVAAQKAGAKFQLPFGSTIATLNGYAYLADGSYRIGFRPHHMSPTALNADSVTLMATVIVTELTGSESYVHIDCAGERWVMLVHGIHDFPMGAQIEVHLDTRHLLIFDETGRAIP